MTDDQIRECIKRMRKVAEPVGPMHGYWDVIIDAEQILKGSHPWFTRAQIEASLTEMFPDV